MPCIFDGLTSAKNSDTVILDKRRRDGVKPRKMIDATYRRPYQKHGSIGISCAIAKLGDDDVMTIHPHSQNVFALTTAVAQFPGVDDTRIRYIQTQGPACYRNNMADDAAANAALLAALIPGRRPVRGPAALYPRPGTLWEPYGSAMVIKTSAGVDAERNALDWSLDLWSTSHGTRAGGKAGNLLSSPYVDPPVE